MSLKIGQHRRALARRVTHLNGVAQAMLLVIAAGYWFVQIAEGAYYRELADNNRLRKLTVEAPRGLILDRHGRALAENVPSYSLLLDRSLSRSLPASLDFAATILDRQEAELTEILEQHRRTPSFQPIRMAEGLTLAQLARFDVEKFEHPEFEIHVEQLRLYRHAHQTAHLLGYLGEVTRADLARPGSPYRSGDLIGKKGLEALYEKHLRGATGERVVIVDSRGQLIEEYKREPAKNGRDLTLTLDLNLQQAAAKLLEGQVGSIVALDPALGRDQGAGDRAVVRPQPFRQAAAQRRVARVARPPASPFAESSDTEHLPPGIRVQDRDGPGRTRQRPDRSGGDGFLLSRLFDHLRQPLPLLESRWARLGQPS